MHKRHEMDFGFLITVLALLAFGLVMVFSASTPDSLSNYGNSYHVVVRQAIWALLGIGVMIFVANIDYHRYVKYAFPLVVVTLVLLLLVPFAGIKVNGARRWLGVGSLSFQPSELAKITMIYFLAYALSSYQKQLQKSFKCFLIFLAVIGVFALLVLIEPHMSGAMVLIFVGVIMMFLAGAQIKHFLAIGIPGFVGAVMLILSSDYRRARLFTFFDPWQDRLGDGYQVIQSLYAIGSGGLFGLGLGQSRQKYLYIPEAQNDFIFSIICEELGFFGAAAVILLFTVLIWRGVKIAMNASDSFGAYLAGGMTALIAVQVLINIAVVTSSMPATGMQLPFFSAGGSSLIFLMAGMGLVLSVSRYTKQ